MSNNWCDGCRRTWDENDAPMAPVLDDASWAKIAAATETLCGSCFFQRINERHVALALADLRPCPVNLRYWPHSWFNFFAREENPPTIVEDGWRSAWLSRNTFGISRANRRSQ